MIKLINGRGHLGEALEIYLKHKKLKETIYIYHTWNLKDKSLLAQKAEYDKFIGFCRRNENAKIVFISTLNTGNCDYVKYKRKAECFLKAERKNRLIIRLPSLIGPGGIFDRCASGVRPKSGVIPMATFNSAAKYIISICDSVFTEAEYTVSGVDAEIVYELIQYGKGHD